MFRFHVVCSDEEKRADAGIVPPIHFQTSETERAQYHDNSVASNSSASTESMFWMLSFARDREACRVSMTQSQATPSTNDEKPLTTKRQQQARVTTRSSTAQSPLETYLREINETALLTAEDELMLAERIGAGDVLAHDRMVRANLRLVVNIARAAAPSHGTSIARGGARPRWRAA